MPIFQKSKYHSPGVFAHFTCPLSQVKMGSTECFFKTSTHHFFSISSEQGHATRQKAFLRFPSIDQIRDRPVELHENHFYRANVKKVYRLNDKKEKKDQCIDENINLFTDDLKMILHCER